VVIRLDKGKIVSIEERIPKLKQQRRKKANRRLVTLLSLFFLLIVCVVYFQSPLSHIKKIKVTGNNLYKDEHLIKSSGLSTGMNIWKLDKEQVEKKMIKLPEIETANVKWIFPNNVLITVKEYERIAVIAKDNSYIPVLENGEILEDEGSSNSPSNAPILIGFTEGEILNEMVSSMQKLPFEILNSISEVNYTPKETDRFHISLFMNDGNEVSASLRSFSKKMIHYPSIVSQLDPSQKGVIDLEVGSYFKSYKSEGVEKSEEEGEG
jgi:cell division protein FtsQ